MKKHSKEFSETFRNSVKNFIKLFLSKKTFYKKKDPGSVYVLLLDKNKVYVGFSKKPEERIKKHFINPKTSFLLKFKPLELIYLVPNSNKKLETDLTKNLMIEFGINNIRGGPFTTSEDYSYQPKQIDDFNTLLSKLVKI